MEEEIIFRVEVPGAEKAVSSIENLTKANKALREERKKLDLDSTAGQARAQQINAQLDANTEKIKANSSALEKQRLNVGNYTGALDTLVPGLGATANGFASMAKQALVFIATPIGAVIGAIGLAIGGLIQYFKRTEEGGDKLNKIVFVMEALFGKLLDVGAKVGGVLFSAFENPKQALMDFGSFLKDQVVNRFNGLLELIPQLSKAIGLLFEGKFGQAGEVAFNAVTKVTTGVENLSGKIRDFAAEVTKAVDDAIAAGNRMSKLDQLLGDQEEALTIQRAQTGLEVAKRRSQAIALEGDARRAMIEEAIALEEKLADKEVAFAKTKLAIAKEEQEVNGVTGDSKQAVAEATAAVIDAEARRFEATLRFSKELEALAEQDKKRREKELEEEIEREIALEEKEKEKRDKLVENYATQQEKLRKIREDTAKKESALDKSQSDEKKKALESLNKVVKDQTIAGKSLAAGTALVNTYQGATEILKQKSTLPSPLDFITKALNFAATISTGLGAVRAIGNIGFARGGFLGGLLTGASHAEGGIPFSVGGRLGFEAEGGEVIINKKSSAMFRSQLSAINVAGGGTSFAVGGVPGEVARISESATNQRALYDAISQIKVVATIEDINLGQERVEIVDSRAVVFR